MAFGSLWLRSRPCFLYIPPGWVSFSPISRFASVSSVLVGLERESAYWVGLAAAFRGVSGNSEVCDGRLFLPRALWACGRLLVEHLALWDLGPRGRPHREEQDEALVHRLFNGRDGDRCVRTCVCAGRRREQHRDDSGSGGGRAGCGP